MRGGCTLLRSLSIRSSMGCAIYKNYRGGGYKRYLPTLSRNRFGGALWLRLKSTSETLLRQEVGSHSRVGKLLISNLSVRRQTPVSEVTSHLLTGISPFGLMRLPTGQLKSYRATHASNYQRIIHTLGLNVLSLAGKGRTVNTPFMVMGSFKGRRCSFIQEVASNNARMEVAV